MLLQWTLQLLKQYRESNLWQVGGRHIGPCLLLCPAAPCVHHALPWRIAGDPAVQ
jgi:hypothetical protein